VADPVRRVVAVGLRIGVFMPEFDIGWMYITLLSLFGLAEVKYARVGAHVRVAE
jgi:fatty-acid desaturase